MRIQWFRHKSLLEMNLELIAPKGRAMVLAYDQGFEHGPGDFSENPESANFEYILKIVKEGGFTGLVVHGGIAEKYKKNILDSEVPCPLILKLNGKSKIYTAEDPYSPLLYGRNAEEAVQWAADHGAKAVGYTVYTGSKYENKMNQEFSQIAIEAHKLGLVVIGWMYPRGECVQIESAEETVAYGARVGLELGADIVKVKYTGDADSFRWVVECARPTKVVMSGGDKDTIEKFLSKTVDAMNAGASGVFVGRNVWQDKQPLEVSKKLREIIFR